MSVDTPRAIREQRLIEDEGETAESVKDILDDPTEQEIPQVQESASVKLSGVREVETNAKEILRFVGT